MTRHAGSLGLDAGVVRVVPYDPAWPELFAAEVARLDPILLSHGGALRLEHTGSTAVPGLAAKPVLDILAGIHDESERRGVIAALQEGGHVHRGEQGIPGRDFFRRGEPRQYHVHLAVIGGSFWRDHRAFRDYLRAHADVADSYAMLKRELAARYPLDREAYIDGKSAFVQAILQLAASLGSELT
jgi:GrpB-like predicted nucleotidyltransferase (UPF0157 family)